MKIDKHPINSVDLTFLWVLTSLFCQIGSTRLWKENWMLIEKYSLKWRIGYICCSSWRGARKVLLVLGTNKKLGVKVRVTAVSLFWVLDSLCLATDWTLPSPQKASQVFADFQYIKLLVAGLYTTLSSLFTFTGTRKIFLSFSQSEKKCVVVDI